MATEATSLKTIFDGWDTYQASLVNAIRPLAPEQLSWRPAARLRTAGEIARHIALGRVAWFLRMRAPGSEEVAGQIEKWDYDPHGNAYVVEEAVDIAGQAAELARWLEATWEMIDKTLNAWSVPDLSFTYRHTWRGDTYAIPRQWTLWRIVAHDLHHGGELAVMLGLQGIELLELGDLGGHLTLPPLAEGG
jgi:uncharacterized damage-inducible protein DinB